MFGQLDFTTWANTTIAGQDYYAAQTGDGTTVILHKFMINVGMVSKDVYEQLLYTANNNPFNIANWDDDPNGQTFSAVKDDYVSFVNA